jgi:hypothetical protein
VRLAANNMVSKLCDECCKLIAAIRPGKYQHEIRPISTQHRFHESAEDGCSMCTHVLLGFSEQESDTLQCATSIFGANHNPCPIIDFRLVEAYTHNMELLLYIILPQLHYLGQKLPDIQKKKKYAIYPIGNILHLPHMTK